MLTRAVLLAACFTAASAAAARATVLYDGGVDASPTAHGLQYNALPPAVFYTVAGGGTTLDTSAASGIYAGFGEATIPLDRAAGYAIRVDAQILGESRTSDDRAGFSLIAISSDLRGIELGFQPTRVFAQGDSPLFTAAEATTNFNPTAAHSYVLTVLDNAYSLKADGATILTGALRNYTAFTGLFGINPYSVPNAFFIGDDTTSATTASRFSYVSVPEPASVAAVAGLTLLARRRRG